MLTVLAERVREVSSAHTCRLLSHSVLLLEHILLLTDLSEPWVLECLRGRDSVVCVVDKKFLDQVDHLWTCLWDQFGDSCTLNSTHSELGEVHVTGMALELI